MTQTNPKLARDLDYTSLQINAEEGFLLSRIDGQTSAAELCQLTGLSAEQIDAMLNKLQALGALQPQPPTTAKPALAPGAQSANPDLADLADDAEQGAVSDSQALDLERNFRKLFETQLHPRPADQRVDLARQGHGAELCALCFDPDPAVIQELLVNDEVGLQHGRLIAAHHYNPVGLDALATDPRFLRDRQVQRFLLRNRHSGEGLLRRILNSQSLPVSYQTLTRRDLSERAQRASLKAFRRCFSQASAEERVGLILKSEGRCLARLHGISLDGKTTAQLCSRTFTSSLLIQNLLRWPATPPPVLLRLAAQASVKRTAALKQMVLRHPNCPTQLKRAT